MQRPLGWRGGRKVKRDFWFAQADGDRYPSESDIIQNSVIRVDNAPASWSWALAHAELNDLWLVLKVDITSPETRYKELNRARAAVWATGKTRRGMVLTSQVIDDLMYIRVVK
jgi:hypothetical protein